MQLQLQLNLNERVTSMQRYLLQPARVEQAVQEQKLQVGTEKGLQALTMELLHPSQVSKWTWKGAAAAYMCTPDAWIAVMTRKWTAHACPCEAPYKRRVRPAAKQNMQRTQPPSVRLG